MHYIRCMQKWTRLSAVFSVVLITGFLLIFFQALIKPLVIGGLLALLLLPLCNKLESIGLNRTLSLFVSLLIFLGVFFLLSAALAGQLKNIGQELPVLMPRIEQKLDALRDDIENLSGISPADQIDVIKNNAKELSQFSGGLFNELLNAAGGVVSLVLSFFYMFLFLLYRNGILRFLMMLSSRKPEQAESIIGEIKNMMRNYFRGVVVVMLIVATLNSLGLYLLGIKHFLFFGILSAALSIIPYIGIFAAGSVCVFYTWICSEDLFHPLMVTLVFYVVQVIEGNLLTPLITGGNARINAIATLFGLLLGSALWGVTGMIIAIPVLATTKIICDHIPEWKAIGFLIGEELSTTPKVKKKRKKISA